MAPVIDPPTPYTRPTAAGTAGGNVCKGNRPGGHLKRHGFTTFDEEQSILVSVTTLKLISALPGLLAQGSIIATCN